MRNTDKVLKRLQETNEEQDNNEIIEESGNMERDLKGVVGSFVHYLMDDPEESDLKEHSIEHFKRLKNVRLFDDRKAQQFNNVDIWLKTQRSLEHGIMNIIKRNL